MKNISNEDIDFLKNLQHELLTQDNDCQADPRFWVVAENEREYGVDSGYSDGEVVCNVDGDEWDTKEDFIEYLVENDYLSETEVDIDEDYDFEEIINLLPETFQREYYTCGYRDHYDSIAENTMFITKSSCQKHIDLNGYHYKKPHTYAMTAWRNPEVGRLYKILKETDWDSVVEFKGD